MEQKIEAINKRQYYSALDILKFTCALFIVLHHYQMIFNLWFEGRLNFNNGYFYFGFLVELFFMVSGFLMENSIQGKPYGDFGTMFKNKYLRFFPMCFLSVTVYTILQWIGKILSGEFFDNGQIISFWNYLISSLLFSKGWGINIYRPANSSLWYINILLIVYIWHFVLNKLTIKLKVPVVYFYIAMVILGLNIYEKELPYAFFDNDCGIGYITTFLGMILFHCAKNFREVSRKLSFIILAATAIIAVILVKYGYWSIFKEDQHIFLIFVLYPPVLLLLSTSKILNRESFSGISKYLGKLSYEMYVWHFPLLILMSILLYVTKFPIVHGYKSMAVFEIVVVAFAVIVCKFVEPPLDRLTARIKDGLKNCNE